MTCGGTNGLVPESTNHYNILLLFVKNKL